MEKDQLIINLWDEGLTATQIGEQIGTTRSAILGRISRLRTRGVHIDRRVVDKKAVKAVIKTGGTGKKRLSLRVQTSQLVFDYLAPPAPVEVVELFTPPPAPVMDEDGVNLFDLKSNQCHYIVGRKDDMFFYCGTPIHRRQMCSDHYKRCYYVVANKERAST